MENESNSFFYRVREFVWGYPDSVLSFHSSTKPLTYILIGSLLAAILGQYLLLPTALQALSPKQRDSFTEASVGQLGTLNPLFVDQNHVDRDLHELIYDKLIYVNPDGSVSPGIASKWDISTDGKVYTLTIDSRYYWHDGKKVEADDVMFTLETSLQLFQVSGIDSIGKSFVDVSVKRTAEDQITLTLPNANASFLEALAIYIVPKHIFKDIILTELYDYGKVVMPVGSGQYRAVSVNDAEVVLMSFDRYPVQPKIKQINYRIYPNVELLKASFQNNMVDAVSGLNSQELSFVNDYPNFDLYSKVITVRKKLLYINVTDTVLSNENLRHAFAYMTNKDGLLSEAGVDGRSTHTSIPSNSWAFPANSELYKYSIDKANEKFEAAGYKQNESGVYSNSKDEPLQLTITYLDNEVNGRIAEYLADTYKDIGVLLVVKPVKYDVLVNEILARRKFQLLLFEVETSMDPDQYNLWHSTKTDYPDINISGYKFLRADFFLERARTTLDKKQRLDYYLRFQTYLIRDVPAIILYEPKYNYLIRDSYTNVNLDSTVSPQDRFNSIDEWELR